MGSSSTRLPAQPPVSLRAMAQVLVPRGIRNLGKAFAETLAQPGPNGERPLIPESMLPDCCSAINMAASMAESLLRRPPTPSANAASLQRFTSDELLAEMQRRSDLATPVVLDSGRNDSGAIAAPSTNASERQRPYRNAM